MSTKTTILFIAFVSLLLTSCSKKDEIAAPISPSQNQDIVWVNYTHTVNTNDLDIEYSIEYLSNTGIQTITSQKGNFSVRVPTMQTTKNGESYAKTMVSIQPVSQTNKEITPLHSQLTISTDNGLILAQAGQTNYDCGYDERTLNEEKPLSWFSYKF